MYFDPPFNEEPPGYGHVDGVILCDEHTQPIEYRQLFDFPVVDIQLCIFVDLQLDRKIKGAPLAFFSLQLKVTGEETDQLFADGEAQTGAPVFSGRIRICLGKTFEYL